MRFLKMFAWLVLAGALLLGVGCSTLEPIYVISLHEYSLKEAGAVSRLNLEAAGPGMTKATDIARIPFVDARNLYKADVVPSKEKPGRFGIRLYADAFGKNRLMQAAGGRDGLPFAVVVDGFYVGESKLDEAKAYEGILELAPLWGEREAKSIADNVSVNYMKIGEF